MNLLNYILTSVVGNDALPSVLLGIVVAYLTIIISVAIAIFGEKKEFEELDRNVILDHIIKAKYLLFFLGLALLPLLFWNGPLPCIRLLLLFFWIIGIVFITMILRRSYHWMKGNKFRLRFKYLSALQNSDDIEEVWRSVWQTENINIKNEREFFKTFHSKVNQFLENDKEDNLLIVSKLLSDFDSFIDKRSTIFLTFLNGALDNVLQWHFIVWKKEYEYLGQKDKLEIWSIYNELSRTLDSILRRIEIRALKNKASFSFFNKFEKHAEKYKKESVSSRYYIESLFDIFYKAFFQNIYHATDSSAIWDHYFPSQWMITKKNLESSENIIPVMSCNKFLEWARDRIWQATEEKDLSLNDVSTNLFPEVDPVLWAKILIFVYTPYSSDNRLRSVIEKTWNFGLGGRVKVYNAHKEDELEQTYKNEETNTFDLSIYIFRREFSKANLESYIKSLKQLSYPKDSVEERKKLQLYRLFSNMLKYLDLSMKP